MSDATKILHDTRAGGYQAILPFVGNIKESCFEAVRGHPAGMTAEEIHEAVGCSLNCARSRSTELFNERRFTVIGKRPNKASTRQIAVYAVPLGGS